MNEQRNDQEALDLRAYLRPIWRRKWIVLAIVVIATAATYFISSREPKSYVASTSLYVHNADPTQNIANSGSATPPSSQDLADVARLVVSQPTAKVVAQHLGMPVSSAGSVTAAPISGSDFITITATSHTSVLAARLANTYASVFVLLRRQAVQGEAAADQHTAQVTISSIATKPKNPGAADQRQTLLQQIATYREIALNPPSGLEQINTALAPTLPTSPQPKRDALFGGVAGLVLGVIAAFCIELLDRRLISVATIESMFERPVLAVLPHVRKAVPVAKGRRAVVAPRFVEELRNLTVVLRLTGNAGAPRTIMITSALPREGKSTVTRNLALAYAESGERVLAIDGDLRRPSLERLFGIEADRGLMHVLRGEASLSEVAVTAIGTPGVAKASGNGRGPATVSVHREPNTASKGRRFRYASRRAPVPAVDPGPAASVDPWLPGSVEVVTHGERPENPLAVMASGRMKALLAEAAKIYDVVLLDTPPVLAVADCVPLMEIVDSVVLVARLGQTTRHAADHFGKLLDRLSSVNFSGVIANDRRASFDDDGYGSYGRYGYGYDKGSKRSRRKQKGRHDRLVRLENCNPGAGQVGA